MSLVQFQILHRITINIDYYRVIAIHLLLFTHCYLLITADSLPLKPVTTGLLNILNLSI
jgi:hypothetical protein